MLGGLQVARTRKATKTKLVLIREPNGRASRSAEEKETAPAQVRRLRDAALAGMADEQWGTELGRLFLAGQITPPMYAAGKKWAERARRYQSAINCPPASPKSCAAEDGGFSEPPDPDSVRGEEVASSDSLAVRAFQEAHAILCAAGLLAERAVRGVCERDEVMAGDIHRAALHRGLHWLVDYWGLTEAPQRAKRHVR